MIFPRLKRLCYVIGFPLFSLFSRRTGFCIFYRVNSAWYAFTRGKAFPVREPRLWVLEYFRHSVPRSGGIVFDVGGELGYETEQFSTMIEPGGRVYVFECLPDHVTRLQAIAAMRKNITVVERACWNQNMQLEFFVGRTPGSNTAVPEAKGQVGQSLADPSKAGLVVQAETLDCLWRRLTQSAPIDFLKMDIEGAEYEALAGAVELLKHTRYVVIAAYHIRDGFRTADKVSDILKTAGFLVRIDENHHVYAERKFIS